jgi:hypothetical protein
VVCRRPLAREKEPDIIIGVDYHPSDLDHLQISVSKRETEILKMQIDPTLSSLHHEPRFQKNTRGNGIAAAAVKTS